MTASRILKELLFAVGLVAFGLIGLPALVYLVGQQLLGEYEAGLVGFYDATGRALLEGSPFAWMLVMSPLLTIELLRFGFRIRRQRRIVS